jgi:peptidoglycan/xylan/chitin deacetylase (PgdA/CDA1 family)
MSRPNARLRPVLLLLGVVALVAAVLPAAMAAAVARPVRLEAGIQRGYTFSSTGAVLSTKTVTLASPADLMSSDRVWVTGRGAHFRMSTGSLSGLLVPESMVAFTPGMLVTKNYSPAVRVAFPAGRYLGYKFDAGWKIVSTKVATLATSSGASISRRAMIHGRPFGQVVNGIWAGYWVPIVAPNTLTAQGLTCRAPGHVAAGSAQFFRVLPGAVNQVALTFDMGGRIAPGLDIVNRLILDRVCTTFFPTGAMTATTEGQRIVKLIGAHPELFELANHTDHHCNLRDGGGGSPTTAPCPTSPPSASFIRAELLNAAAILKAASGMEPAPYWRAPYGATNSAVLSAAAAAGYTKTFHWDVDTIDWRPVADGGPTAADIANKVAVNAVNGTDVLMHLGGWNTYNALPSMVHRLRTERKLQPTTISDILR